MGTLGGYSKMGIHRLSGRKLGIHAKILKRIIPMLILIIIFCINTSEQDAQEPTITRKKWILLHRARNLTYKHKIRTFKSSSQHN